MQADLQAAVEEQGLQTSLHVGCNAHGVRGLHASHDVPECSQLLSCPSSLALAMPYTDSALASPWLLRELLHARLQQRRCQRAQKHQPHPFLQVQQPGASAQHAQHAQSQPAPTHAMQPQQHLSCDHAQHSDSTSATGVTRPDQQQQSAHDGSRSHEKPATAASAGVIRHRCTTCGARTWQPQLLPQFLASLPQPGELVTAYCWPDEAIHLLGCPELEAVVHALKRRVRFVHSTGSAAAATSASARQHSSSRTSAGYHTSSSSGYSSNAQSQLRFPLTLTQAELQAAGLCPACTTVADVSSLQAQPAAHTGSNSAQEQQPRKALAQPAPCDTCGGLAEPCRACREVAAAQLASPAVELATLADVEWAASLVCSRTFQSSQRGTMVMVPLLDMANHTDQEPNAGIQSCTESEDSDGGSGDECDAGSAPEQRDLEDGLVDARQQQQQQQRQQQQQQQARSCKWHADAAYPGGSSGCDQGCCSTDARSSCSSQGVLSTHRLSCDAASADGSRADDGHMGQTCGGGPHSGATQGAGFADGVMLQMAAVCLHDELDTGAEPYVWVPTAAAVCEATAPASNSQPGACNGCATVAEATAGDAAGHSAGAAAGRAASCTASDAAAAGAAPAGKACTQRSKEETVAPLRWGQYRRRNQLYSTQPVHQGDEVTFTYHEGLRNDELLIYYGFLPAASAPNSSWLCAVDHPQYSAEEWTAREEAALGDDLADGDTQSSTDGDQEDEEDQQEGEWQGEGGQEGAADEMDGGGDGSAGLLHATQSQQSVSEASEVCDVTHLEALVIDPLDGPWRGAPCLATGTRQQLLDEQHRLQRLLNDSRRRCTALEQSRRAVAEARAACTAQGLPWLPDLLREFRMRRQTALAQEVKRLKDLTRRMRD